MSKETWFAGGRSFVSVCFRLMTCGFSGTSRKASWVIVISDRKYESGVDMPLGFANHVRTARAVDLPPPFRAVALREAGDAFAHAIRSAPHAGAGTLVHVGRFDLVEFAVVL